jgi:3-methyladenine DNA glycosylase AlkD
LGAARAKSAARLFAPRQTALLARRELAKHADPERAAFFVKFFKAGRGEYAAGDRFLGLTVPSVREVAREYQSLPLRESLKLLRSPIHEERLLALIILERQFQRGDETQQRAIFHLYLAHLRHVNHWDLVDLSCRTIVGEYLRERDRALLYKLARSRDMWRRRVSIVSTFTFIRTGDCADTLKIARMLLHDDEDLIHKAVGWMLREAGKRDPAALETFLNRHAADMPRTMLRYAIERLSPARRMHFMTRRVETNAAR